ncbi:amidohydrolase family protein [Lutibacter sp.]|uniref:amidohydrolase family protein n=1 Tax=Lutibacter sp. TaxID=1925666 RepID=UPI0027336DD8|nr:amidohydrolase family protein [Lutibacter sp.]MDP3312658.1 amidohydrolase family protein [Lutibacter sp.]
MKKTFSVVLLLLSCITYGQEYFPANTEVKVSSNNIVAFKNAKIYITPTTVVNNGILLIENGKIIASGTMVTIPKNAEVIDVSGKSIYPSFIDIYSNFGMEKPKREPQNFNNAQYDATRSGYYWNDHIRPETKGLDHFKFDDKLVSDYLKEGFGTVNTHFQDGIIRGNGVLIALNPNSNDSYRIIDTNSAQYLSFQKSSQSRQMYPNSLMGAMALIRQTYLDADWYAKGMTKNKDLSLEALNKNKNLPQIFEAGSKLNALRADKVGDEFAVQYVIVGGGDEYENIREIKNTNATFILPLNFRKAYDVSDPFLAADVDLSDLKKWNQEPYNPKVLNENGVPFVFTMHSLKSVSEFSKNLQKAIEVGLNKTAALEALTTVPAAILGKSHLIGSLKNGSYANFLITSGDLFDKNTIIYENWVQGKKNSINSMDIKDLTGSYDLKFNNSQLNLTITGKADKQTATLKKGEAKVASKFSFKDNWIYLQVKSEIDSTKYVQLSSRVQANSSDLSGNGIDEKGNTFNWEAKKSENDKEKITKEKPDKSQVVESFIPVTFPNVAFGFNEKPKQTELLIKNATVWTGENQGILKNTDILIKSGKIVQIGSNINGGKATIIDGTGKHLTAGIIDEHTHIGTDAVNEAGHNSTAEVSIEDVINPDDIKIYRNLAGGVTSAQILHGSANPIGGRSAIIKMKWGENATNLIYTNTPKFIKFALGENVKQSRSTNGTRFPQTRMGVEQLFIDYFQRAKEYDVLKKSGKPFRKDIELDILAEIINGERYISCHSYVQSEINMLMKVAEQFNFKINTFTHILEGYKVADKMKEHGVGASTFADWWAYKFEVVDAIPQNPSILHNVGVTVAINSDDAEMGRRLNQEAAKSIKYGNVSEIDALNFVTINPAKLLHIDHRVGSIKVGKDADVVLWSDHPLSVYAKAEKTIIEGVIYFDMEKDLELRTQVKEERNNLINLMLNEKSNGGETQSVRKKPEQDFHCDTVLHY